MGILSVLSGIAYVSYKGYIVSVSKKDLKFHGELFASSVQNCITVRGGWNITPLKNNGIPNTDQNATPETPCKPTGTNQDDIKNSLKKKLDFTCPADADCITYTNTRTTPEHYLYTCLSIQKKVSGKKLQVISRVSYKNPNEYQVVCGVDVSPYPVHLGDGSCKRTNNVPMRNAGFDNLNSPPGSKVTPCPW